MCQNDTIGFVTGAMKDIVAFDIECDLHVEVRNDQPARIVLRAAHRGFLPRVTQSPMALGSHALTLTEVECANQSQMPLGQGSDQAVNVDTVVMLVTADGSSSCAVDFVANVQTASSLTQVIKAWVDQVVEVEASASRDEQLATA